MLFLKRTLIAIILAAAIQISTFYFFAKRQLVKEIGKNYESYVLQHKENCFENIGLQVDWNISIKEIKSNFKSFEPYKITLFKPDDDLFSLRQSDYFYLYSALLDNIQPFGISIIEEGEMAKEFGASWESRYV